ncbi:MAG: NADH-quinone oxidoreductase subunit [Clostridia bacterium]|nr:NADH-quinone oxidoreductase subunit [Clostridia bacterium]
MQSLTERRKQIKEKLLDSSKKSKVIVGMGTCGIAAGAKQVLSAMKEEAAKEGLEVEFLHTGCIGMCHREVNVEVSLPGKPNIIYGDVTPEIAKEIVQVHLKDGEVLTKAVVAQVKKGEEELYEGIPQLMELPFYSKQYRKVLKNCGKINPDSIEEYIANDGYLALENVLSKMSQEEVIEHVKKSGLRGRGGGGFPTGLKWEFTYKAEGDKKYVVCNADEGDPGAFMDRSVLEGDPHALLEGMLICGYAVGADEGYIYVRAEYPLAIQRLKNAIQQAEKEGLLGENILDSGFNFKLNIKAGAGAFVCGEETALLASIEGERGMPRVRPPFPAQKGLWGKPTNINNVETYANVPDILRTSGDEYARVGTEGSKGTKVFAITGKVQRTGLAEVPMGITMREIIYDIGGVIQNDKKYKSVQIGGPSGGCLPEKLLDLPVDYDSLKEVGAMMGSGGLVVMDETTCMVDVARFFLTFTQKESCGKCTPCREGTKRMLEILERITKGQGEKKDLQDLERLGKVIKSTALCGLGQTAPNPVLTTMKYFKDEYLAHINDKKCPAGVCKELITYRIDQEKCTGCTLCAKHCPVGAITGEKKQPHYIDPEKCTRCGVCITKCKKDAIYLA